MLCVNFLEMNAIEVIEKVPLKEEAPFLKTIHYKESEISLRSIVVISL